jgi:hypothetical protein
MDNTACTTHEPASTSVTRLLTLIDWTALPAETRQTIQTIGPLMQEGCSRAEMARRLGWPPSRVTAAVDEIRDAILAQCEAMLDSLEPRLRTLVLELKGT